MEFFDIIEKRHSIRSFKSKEIEEDKLQKILDAVNKAPSAGNLQSYEVFLVRDLQKKRQLADAALGQDFIAEAPIVLIFCSNISCSSQKYGDRGEKLYSLQDATIATTFAMLTATSLELVSCWVGAFDDKQVLKVLGNPKNLVPVSILPIGYPAEKHYITSRRRLEDLIHEI